MDLIIFAVLFAIGYFAGRWNEKRHYASIRSREQEFQRVLVFTNRFPPSTSTPMASEMVTGSVVISEDFFKGVLAGLYSFFGGRIRSYESLLDRARREAVLRMKAEAKAKGSEMIVNVKFQTFAVGGRNPESTKGVEVLVYGTALAPLGTALSPAKLA